MSSFADRLDGFQRRHRVIGFPLAVTYKFFDDQSNYLAAVITYYTFAATVPLLLISSSVLGFLLQGNDSLRTKLLDSAVGQFPIIGTQLKAPEGLTGSTLTVVLGALVAVYGILGLGQAAQNAVHVAWAIPRNSRPNPFLQRLNSGLFMIVAGFVVLVVAVLTSVAPTVQLMGDGGHIWLTWAARGVAVLLTAAVFTVLMQFATPSRERWRDLLPGALVTALLWQVLQLGGNAYVDHVLKKASDLTTAFAVPLGLLALIYVAANMAVIGVQVNVVIRKHLWPRALLTPFTDAVELTDADQRAYASYAMAQRHKGFETVSVTFDRGTEEPGVSSVQSPAKAAATAAARVGRTPKPGEPAEPSPSGVDSGSGSPDRG
ncbi:MAG: ribonuclease [Nocardioidaceae bacterium]|nr:ribonuclease [Nocardioidaceae bacterium]